MYNISEEYRDYLGCFQINFQSSGYFSVGEQLTRQQERL